MFNVIKRDGEVAAFQLSKITQAIEKAFQAQEKQYTPDMMEMLGLRVTADFQKKIKKDPVWTGSLRNAGGRIKSRWRIFRTAWKMC